ncbi:MAG: VTT domain-containing protein [Dehalococcoidales bacterium]|nr:VTT domain-containing protein [Dehalococcoidales bacterium]
MAEHTLFKRHGNTLRWLKLALAVGACIGLSFGLTRLLQIFMARMELPLEQFSWLVYLNVFLTTLVFNLSIIAPVPVSLSVMIAAASQYNPALIALAASIGGAIGELSGYFAGYLGRKVALSDNIPGYQKVTGWLDRYGVFAVIVLAFQPVFPFDVAGLIAGAAKMPLYKFLPALWIGKFFKYLVVCYSGAGLISLLSF